MIAFWLLAILVTWGSGVLIALSTDASMVNGSHVRSGAWQLPFPLVILLLLVSGSGPGIASIIICWISEGLAGVRALLRQVLSWAANPGWYMAALVLPFVLTLGATFLWGLVGGRPNRWLPLPTSLQLLALPIFPWGEELGWRGFAQPRLQHWVGWLPASVAVGFMWGLWHQWPLLTGTLDAIDAPGIALFLVYIVSAAVLIGWVYNRGGKRLPLGWAGHAGLNVVGPSNVPFILVASMFAIAALAAAVIGAPERFKGMDSRER